MTVQVRHVDGYVHLIKEGMGVLILTEEEATSLMAPMCPKCLKPVGEFPLAVTEAKQFNRDNKLRKITELEHKVKELKESLR